MKRFLRRLRWEGGGYKLPPSTYTTHCFFLVHDFISSSAAGGRVPNDLSLEMGSSKDGVTRRLYELRNRMDGVVPQQGEIDFWSTVTSINITQRSLGKWSSRITSEYVWGGPRWEYKLCIAFQNAPSSCFITPTQQLARLMQSCKTKSQHKMYSFKKNI